MDKKRRIEMLGGFVLLHGSAPMPTPRQSPLRIILTYLALHLGYFYSRAKLIEILWADAEFKPQDRRNSLAQVIVNLQNLLESEDALKGNVVLVRGEEISLNPEWVETDVREFQAAYDVCMSVEGTAQDAQERAQRFKEAVRLYRDLLPGDTSSWIAPERARLAEQNRGVLRCLIVALIEANRHQEAIEFSRRLVASFASETGVLSPKDEVQRDKAQEEYLALSEALHSKELQNALSRPPDADAEEAEIVTATRGGPVMVSKEVPVIIIEEPTPPRKKSGRAGAFLAFPLLLALGGLLALGVLLVGLRHTPREGDRDRLYQAGRAHWNERTEEGLRQSRAEFARVTELDPKYAPGFAGLADADSLLGYYGWVPPGNAFAQAVTEAQAATLLARTPHEKAEAFTSLAWVEMLLWQWEPSRDNFKQALDADASYPTAWQWHSLYLMVQGDKFGSLNEIGKVALPNPSVVIRKSEAQRFYYAGEFDRAISECQDTLKDNPHDRLSRFWLGLAWEQKGDAGQATFWLTQADTLSGGRDMNMRAGLAHAQASFGDAAASHHILADMLDRRAKGRAYVSPVDIAVIFAGLYDSDRSAERSLPAAQEKAQALAWLEQGLGEHAGQMILLGVEPRFRSLRAEPRFARLFQKMPLPPPQAVPAAPTIL